MRGEREAKDAMKLERDRLRAERAQQAAAAEPVTINYPRTVIGPPVIGGFAPYGYGRTVVGGPAFGIGGGPDVPRDVYLQDRRRRGFTPSGTPAWPRDRW